MEKKVFFEDKRDWFDADFIAERKAFKDAVRAKEEAREKRVADAKKAVVGFVKFGFKKVAVA
jgi:hypothetical protein